MSVPKSTSEFKSSDMDLLKVTFECLEQTPFEAGDKEHPPSFLYLQNKDLGAIKNYLNDGTFDNLEKSLCSYIVRVIDNEAMKIGTLESITDSFINYILTKLGLNDYPLNLMMHPNYKFEVNGDTVSSIPEFSIESKGVVLFIDEDKHFNSITPGKHWGEHQIAGELIAAAYTNYNEMLKAGSKRKRDQTVYAMRVIGTRFTFYKANIGESYLISLSNIGKIEALAIYRYPGKDYTGCFNYTDPNDRKIIIDNIMTLKALLQNM